VQTRSVGALNSDCGHIVTDDRERANLLHTCFTSMLCTADNGTNPSIDRVTGLPDDSNNIETIVFTPTLVKAATKKLKLCSASGSCQLKTGRQPYGRGCHPTLPGVRQSWESAFLFFEHYLRVMDSQYS